MSDPLTIGLAAFYVVAFTWLCREAVREGVTVWALLGRSFNAMALAFDRAFADITRGLTVVFAAIGLIPRPRRQMAGPSYPQTVADWMTPPDPPDPRESRIAAARSAYVRGRIEVEDFEAVLDREMRP